MNQVMEREMNNRWSVTNELAEKTGPHRQRRSAIPHLYPIRSRWTRDLPAWRFELTASRRGVDVEMTGSPKFLGDPCVPFAHAQATPVSRRVPDRDARRDRFPVSYTHLTLPTKA